MTQHFTKTQIEEFRQCFHLYANNGFVHNDAQLRYIMRSLGYTPTVNETKIYLKSNNSQIDFAKFLDILHAEEIKGDSLVEVIKAFKGLDSHNRDSIHVSELINLLSSFGEKLSKNEVLAVLKRMHVKSTDTIPIAKMIQYISTSY